MSSLVSIESQHSLLGSFLLYNNLINEAEVSVEDFSGAADQAILREMLASWAEGEPFDAGTIASKLNGLHSVGGIAYLGSLVDGAVPDPGIVRVHCKRIRELADLRRLANLGEELSRESAELGANPGRLIEKAQKRLRVLETEGGPTPSGCRIRKLRDIPDIFSLQIPAMDYLVPSLGIGRNTITLWTGADGDGKTYFAQAMAVAVARGDMFLGMRCQKATVLYIDLENPACAVQERMQALIVEDSSVPGLKIWGQWNEPAPPQAGSDLLLTISKETPSLLIIDPLRYFHGAEENDSTEMARVMQYLRALAANGCATVLLHHPAKSENSTGRGSSVIRGACDLAFLHSLDKESGLITLKVDKNRFGPSRTFTIRADFEEGTFEIADAPYVTRRNDELRKIEDIIATEPGISQNGIFKKAGGNRNRLLRLLKEGLSQDRWVQEDGKYGAKTYSLYRSTDKSLYPKVDTGDTATN